MSILVTNYSIHKEITQEFLEIYRSIIREKMKIDPLAEKDKIKNWDMVFPTLFEKYQKYIKKTSKIAKKLQLIRELGEKYQFFISHQVIFENDKWKIVPRKKKIHQLGTIYTPSEISHFIIRWIFQLINENSYQVKVNWKIADLACGPGQFLIDWIELGSSIRLPQPLSLFGYDNDPIAIQIAALGSFPDLYIAQKDSLFDGALEQTNQFDIIVGNPPYIKSSAIDDNYWNKLKLKFKSAYHKFDLSVVFLEKSLCLLKPGGIAGFIISNKWLTSKYGMKIRDLLLSSTKILAIIDVSQISIFSNVSTYPVIIFFQKRAKIPSKQQKSDIEMKSLVRLYHIEKITDLEKILTGKIKGFSIQQHFFHFTPHHSIITNFSINEHELLSHFWNLPQDSFFFLNDPKSPYTLRKGIHTGNCKNKLIVNEIHNSEFDNLEIKPLITSRLKIERYKISWQGLWIRYNKSLIDKSKGDYGSLREPWIFEANPKICIKLFGIRIQAAIDFFRYYTNNSVILLLRKDQNPAFHTNSKKFYHLKEHSEMHSFKAIFSHIEEEFYYILGILNSNLISSYYRIMYRHTHVRGNYLQYYIKDLGKIPIILPTKHNFKIIRDIAQLTRRIVKLHESFLANRVEIEKEEKILNKKIDSLYGFNSSYLQKQID
ncbi:MAG: Eco57I restriction-modification methylase domain-containing protein [Promethearchaeota archaeon]